MSSEYITFSPHLPDVIEPTVTSFWQVILSFKVKVSVQVPALFATNFSFESSPLTTLIIFESEEVTLTLVTDSV